MSSRCRRLLAALLLVPVLAGCGSTSTADRTPRATDSPDATTSSQAEGLPRGWRSVTANDSHLRLGVPETWTLMDVDNMDSKGFREALEDYVASINLTIDQFMAMLRQVDIMVVAPTAVAGMAENLNVVLTGFAEVPSESTIRVSLTQFKADVLDQRMADSPVGEGRLVEAVTQLPGGIKAHLSGFFVKSRQGVVNLTVTSTSRERARNLMDQVLRTLEEVD